MSKHAELAALLASFTKTGLLPFTGKVKSVEGDTCTIIIDGLELDKVKLKATKNNAGNYLVITPAINTEVLVVSLSGDYKNLCVLKCDEVNKIEWKTGNLIIAADATTGKVKIQNSETSLLTILQGLKDLLSQLKVSTPSGISGTPLPPTIQALNNFETAFKQLLN